MLEKKKVLYENDICEKIKYNRVINVYHATNNLQKSLDRGFLGGNVNLYCSLYPEGLYEPVSKLMNLVDGEWVEVSIADLGLLKLDNIPINSLFIDWEAWDKLWYNQKLKTRITHKLSRESLKIFGNIMDSRETGNLLPLRSLYPLCKEIGYNTVRELGLGWLIIPKGRRVRISIDNVIPFPEME